MEPLATNWYWTLNRLKIFQQQRSKTWEQTGNNASDFHPIKFHSSVNVWKPGAAHCPEKSPLNLRQQSAGYFSLSFSTADWHSSWLCRHERRQGWINRTQLEHTVSPGSRSRSALRHLTIRQYANIKPSCPSGSSIPSFDTPPLPLPEYQQSFIVIALMQSIPI